VFPAATGRTAGKTRMFASVLRLQYARGMTDVRQGCQVSGAKGEAVLLRGFAKFLFGVGRRCRMMYGS